MSAGKISEKDVRMFMMDKPELNPLLRGVRWSPEEVDAAVVHAVSMYNETPPFINTFTVESFPWRFTLLLGVTGHLLRSASINEASNNLTYSADNISVNDKDKSEVFLRLGNQYWQEFKENIQGIKVSQNIAAAFGSSVSELYHLAR